MTGLDHAMILGVIMFVVAATATALTLPGHEARPVPQDGQVNALERPGPAR